MDLTATDEVSELMNSAAYETYLKEECEDHWWKHIIAQIQIEVLYVAYEVLHENDYKCTLLQQMLLSIWNPIPVT